MRVLQLCNKVPFPPKDGGCIAMNNLTQGLIEHGCQVKVLAINTPKHFTNIEELPADYRSKTSIETVFIDTEVKITAAFKNLFTSKSYNVERFYAKELEAKLLEILHAEQFDIVQLESLYVSMYADLIKKYSTAKVVLRAHNVEHHLWEYNARVNNEPLKKSYLKLLAKRLRDYELNSLQWFDAILPITNEDEYYFKKSGYKKPMLTVPFGLNVNNYIPSPMDKSVKRLFHIGAMDWQPNIEGIEWFLNTVWEKLHLKFPDLKLALAGRGMSDEFKQLNQPNVEVLGEVENAQNFMINNDIMVVPLKSGSGMRVKIIEAMALGKVVISTPIGAQGIACENDKNILIADTPDEFIAAINKCISDKMLAKTIGSNARALVEAEYDNVQITRKLVDFYRNLISR